MRLLWKFRRLLLDGLYRSPFYPSIFFFPNPFKFVEFAAVKKRLLLNKTDVVLDVGCGSGMQTNTIGRRCGRIVGIDVSRNDIERAKSELDWLPASIESEFRCVAIEEAGFPDGSFDRIVSICVLEHIPDDESVLAEMFRVLKPGGRLVLTVDSLATVCDLTLIDRHQHQYAVSRYYRSKELQAKLEGAGFQEVKVDVLLRSAFAARLFEAGISKRFKYRYRSAVWLYVKLCLHERFSKSANEGIYLVASARKTIGLI